MRCMVSFFVLLMAGPALLYAGSETLSTYYPAPSGNYKKIEVTSIQLVPATRSAIQSEYNCSFDPTSGQQPCPAGLMYYDTDAQMVVVSVGTHWRAMTSYCLPQTACSSSLNCGSDSCGNSCGSCSSGRQCNSTTAGIPGSCG